MRKGSITKSHTHLRGGVLSEFDDLPATALVRLPVVCALLSCSAPTVWRAVKSQRLPRPVKITPGVTGWRVGELRDALTQRVE